MPDAGARPPSQGWYSIFGNPDDLAYFDGQLWTWRRRRDPSGEWHQEPIVPPTAAGPTPAGPGGITPRTGLPFGPAARSAEPRSALPVYSGYSGYSGGSGYGFPPPGQWGGAVPPYLRSSGRLDLHLPDPERQARWETLLRGLLVIPNAIVLAFLELAVSVVAVLMWFAALFTARVPESLWRFATDVLKWQARTYAYISFLTDRYPPFALGDVPYPVSMTLEGPPGRFNRLSVFFRAILVIPAAIVVEVFTWGVVIFLIAAWLITLVRGRCPRALHLMIASWLRYSLRLTAFQTLLTTEYPSGPLGDRPPMFGEPSLQNGDIVLTGSAKALAIVAIVVGAAAYLGYSVAGPTIFRSRTHIAISQRNAFDIAGAPGYQTFAGRAGLPIEEGRPWGKPCQPIVFAAEELPEAIYLQVKQVVQDARADGIDVTIDNNHNRWFPTTLYPPGLTTTDVEFVTVSANAVTTPRLTDGGPEHIDFTWGASPSADGKSDITGLTATLYLKAIDGNPEVTRRSARQLVAFAEGVGGSTARGSGIALHSRVDAFSPRDIAAMRLMGGCR